MDKLKFLIVEDDPASQLTLEAALYELNYRDWLVTNNAEDALKIINSEEPDIILMDIEIGGKLSGIDIANTIKNDPVPIIYITGSEDKATFEKAKKTKPAAYLIKPFSNLTLEAAIDAAVSNHADKTLIPNEETEVILQDCIFIKNGTVFLKVKFEEILWIQSEGNYSIVHTKTKKHALRSSLIKVVEKMPSDIFIRVHKRYLVQAAKIEKIDTADKELFIGNQAIPLGRTYKEVLLKRLRKI